MTLAPGSLVTMAPVRDEAGTQSQPPPKPVEQIQIGDRVMWPGHPRPRTVTGKTVNADGSITLMLGLAAEDNPDDPAFDLTQQGERIHDAYLDAQHTGAHHVKAGLELYKGVAEFYATGPLYELGALALSAAGGKGLELLRLAIEEERFAQEAGALASEARVYAQEAGQAAKAAANEGKTAEEIAVLTKQAEQAEKEGKQLEAGAAEAKNLASQSKPVAEEAKGIAEALKPIIQSGVKDKATAAFGTNSKLAEMTMEERQAAASAYEQVAQLTRGSNQAPGRLYNLERAKFLRGEVDRIAPTLPAFKAERGL